MRHGLPRPPCAGSQITRRPAFAAAFESLLHRKTVQIAVLGDRKTLHVLHDQIGTIVRGHPAIEQGGDVGMF